MLFAKRGRPGTVLFWLVTACFLSALLPRCANIVPPNGGPRDSIPPVLVSAIPPDSSLNFRSKTITLNFDEYLQNQDISQKLIFTPTAARQPIIVSKFRTITIQLKDSLKPNTTYTMNFGDAIRDLDEGNPIRGFTYIFSTGHYLDSLTVTGTVVYAQTGQPDSDIAVMLYRDLSDSVVSKQKPVYYTRTNGKGKFKLENLPHGTFKLFAVKDNNNSLAYEDSSDFIAFRTDPLVMDKDITDQKLYLFAVAAKKKISQAQLIQGGEVGEIHATPKAPKRRIVRHISISPEVGPGGQGITVPLMLALNNQVKIFDTAKQRMEEDTTYTQVRDSAVLDSAGTAVRVFRKWDEDMFYRLIIDSEMVRDSAGAYNRSDTIDFRTKSEADYGSILLHFMNLDSSEHYVVQIVSNDVIRYTAPVTGDNWRMDLVDPGDYEVRVLVDTNGNGIWDNGRYYGGKRQPEHVIAIPQKILVRANWENRLQVTL